MYPNVLIRCYIIFIVDLCFAKKKLKYVGTNQAYQRPKDVVKPFKLVPFNFKLQRLVFISEILINKNKQCKNERTTNVQCCLLGVL